MTDVIAPGPAIIGIPIGLKEISLIELASYASRAVDFVLEVLASIILKPNLINIIPPAILKAG